MGSVFSAFICARMSQHSGSDTSTPNMGRRRRRYCELAADRQETGSGRPQPLTPELHPPHPLRSVSHAASKYGHVSTINLAAAEVRVKLNDY